MTDRELLRKAGAAEGLNVSEADGPLCVFDGEGYATQWNPLLNDGDAACMEAVLRIDLEWQRIGVVACHRAEIGHDIVVREPYAYHNDDRQAARRYASTKVAAALQEAKEGV